VKTFSMEPDSRERHRWVCCCVCGTEKAQPYWNCGAFGFVRCRRCGHIYQNPQPVFDDLRRRYQETYFSYELENDARFFELMMRGLYDVRFHELEETFLPGGRFLDVGCATGMLVEEMGRRGWEAVGTEICAAAAEFGRSRRGVRIELGTLEQIAFPDEHFDLVHFSHVIEHVPDPPALLSEVRRVTKPGGRVVVVTPNTAGLQARLFGSGWRSAIADHLNLFSRHGLDKLLRAGGFRTELEKTWGGLAQGVVPQWLKRPMDRLAKPLGFGDVVCKRARRVRSASSGRP